MQSLFVILLAVVAAESRQVCVPNSSFKQDCNTCFCTADGTSMGCTIMACGPSLWEIAAISKEQPKIEDGAEKSVAKRSYSTRQSVYGRECEPGTTVKHYCNNCLCNKLGRVGRCTRMFCDENLYNEDGSYKIDRQEKECEPGKAFKRDACNVCVCNEYGTRSLCTNKNCVSNLIETHADKDTKRWGPLYKQGDSCAPGESFYSECKQCVCSRNGKSAFCTSMMC